MVITLHANYNIKLQIKHQLYISVHSCYFYDKREKESMKSWIHAMFPFYVLAAIFYDTLSTC